MSITTSPGRPSQSTSHRKNTLCCVLVTGFGPFPGTRSNPSEALVRALGKDRPRLARLGIRLELEILPVAYAEVASRLEALTQKFRPDAVLHLGLAARRKTVSIETRAMNRLSLLRPDARGATAGQLRIYPGARQHLRSTFPAVEIATAFRRAGIACRLSCNAGKYICNETLYLSLARGASRQVGFIHVPHVAPHSRRRTLTAGRRPSLDDLTRAAIVAILVMARKHCCSYTPS